MSRFKSRERVTYEELCNFIQPLKMEIPIELQSTFVINKSLGLYLRSINREIVGSLLPGMDDIEKDRILRSIPLAYVPHMEGYSVSLSPISFINNAIKTIGRYNKINLDAYLLPFYNLDDERELAVFKTAVRNRIKHIKMSVNNEKVNREFGVLSDSLDEIIRIRELDLSKMIGNCVEIKTLLFYIVYTSLRSLERSNNPIYSVLPTTYINEVYKPDALQFPKHVYLYGECFKLGLTDFVREYQTLYLKNNKLFDHVSTDNLGVNTYVGNFELLPSGEAIKKLKEHNARQASTNTRDYFKYYQLFHTKMNYYFHTDIKHILVGNMGLEGYYAFVYGNEYIVSDKFYNSLLVPDYKKSILTHEEGIYALPSDRLDILAMNKQKIKKEKQLDARIKKFNHDPKNTWIDRVNNIIEGANVSSAIFTEKLEELEEKGILTLRKKI